MTYIQQVRNHKLDPARYQLYLRAIWIAILGNGLLVIAKGGTAWFSGSTAVLATAVDSITDVLYTVVMAWGLWLSQQPADESHPQGHGRIEPLISMVIGLAMGVAGWEVVHRAVTQLLGEPARFDWGLPAAVLTGSGLAKVVMYLLVHRLAQQVRSPAINAFARDNLSDVFSSAAALLGVAAVHWIHPLADSIAGILVSLWIFRNALFILTENLGYLTGRAAGPELVEKIRTAACAVKGVSGVHRVVADYVGPQLRVDMHVNVAGETSLHIAHEIGEEVQRVVEALEEVDLAFVHLEPMHPLTCSGQALR